MVDFNEDHGGVQPASSTIKDPAQAGVPSKGGHDEPPSWQGLAETIAGPAIGNNDKYKMH